MTTTAAPITPAQTSADAPPAPVLRGYRFELVKLLAQWPVRIGLLACFVGPAIFVAIVSQQSSLPTDSVFGRWMGQTGWAGALVILMFACNWVLPLLTSLVSGDVFAAEDRLGTWRHLLVAVRSPQRIFASKALAALTVIVVLAFGLALSGIVGGLLSAGSHALVGLDGHLLEPGHAAIAVVLAWLAVFAPTLAFAGIGLLGSVALGRSPMGLVIPAVLALVLGLAQLLPLPVVVRVSLPSYAFIGWRGLFTEPMQTGPLIAGILVSLAWAFTATALAYGLFMRRDFTDQAYDGAGGRVLLRAALPLAGLFVATALVLSVITPASGSGVDKVKLERSLSTSFAHLYRVQTEQLHRPAVTEAQLGATAKCDKGGSRVDDIGPGNDWRCVVSWHLPGSEAAGNAIYQLNVAPEGRYTADGDGPVQVNGFFQVRTARGDVPNPLWQMDGTIDLLTPTEKG